ncbi:MAG: undecaprenyldiphospho-muramoylpentapeptide beta-N-acetylglucosaminyltransferase [Candidatus Eisenbacteria bacterium]|uniref:UDP-N-acetylglucosamine--N-acetylmuramyl-(pentapeptide) pyrophosphoryl-undecaprenol N-acetylglucosamine transferase n=1 Tax=Eiseniibacteriota bacterium TaxID=2212470 RepID=A0A956RN83_UNCEI|nr:undecaprenyldiphospho-muramoylpentapeptide beta-N-acetylglucosaminyltransferase [Candidatus Eisenbacteria bacterium]
MKVMITGGGTGGHLYPALAVADALRPKIGAESIVFVGAQRGLEAEEVPAAGYAFQALESVGFPRKVGPGSIRAGIALFRAVLRARHLIKEFDPDVVFSTGGYASAPVVVAAWMHRIPIVLHEQNSVPGRTNTIASRFASEVHLAFPSARRYFPRRRHLRLSGNPLRAAVLQGSRSRALRQFRLDEDRFTILVLGGSQGSHAVNQSIVDALAIFEGRDDLQFLIQSGQRDHEWMVDRCRALQAKTWVRRFIPNMGDAYELADLVVGRAGAMTISEVTACGLPSILIPYPYATGNHQKLNAEQLEDVGAAIMITEDRLTGAFLAERIDELMRDPRLLRQMALSAHRMARPEATDRIAAALVRYLPGVEIADPPMPERGRRGGDGGASSGGGRRDGGGRDGDRSDRGPGRGGAQSRGDRGPSRGDRGPSRGDRGQSRGDRGRPRRDSEGRRPGPGDDRRRDPVSTGGEAAEGVRPDRSRNRRSRGRRGGGPDGPGGAAGSSTASAGAPTGAAGGTGA